MVSGLLARCIMYVWKLNSLKENKEKFFCQCYHWNTLSSLSIVQIVN